ncbi:HAD-like domain-containing protein [Syncephalis fuscata]|nr:HAD-like domain-containing protein [Syncephalis fuscata]
MRRTSNNDQDSSNSWRTSSNNTSQHNTRYVSDNDRSSAYSWRSNSSNSSRYNTRQVSDRDQSGTYSKPSASDNGSRSNTRQKSNKDRYRLQNNYGPSLSAPLAPMFYPDEGGLLDADTKKTHLLRRAAYITKLPLLVLDLNGTLIHRTKSKQFYARPHLGEFLGRVIQHYAVLIWSSARPENVQLMARHCFQQYDRHQQKQQKHDVKKETTSTDASIDYRNKLWLNELPGQIRYQDYLAALWDRRAFGFTPQEYSGNPVTVKDLQRIWDWRSCWHAGNTLIVDDSPEKTERQPENWIYLSSFTNNMAQKEDKELLRLATYLEEIALEEDLRHALYTSPFNEYRV